MFAKVSFQGSGLLLIAAVLFFTSCVKSDIPPDYAKIKFSLDLKANNQNVIWDSLHIQNAAGNLYQLETMNFYISNVKLKSSTGKVYQSNKIFYIDPSVSTKSIFQLDSIPPGHYTEINFNVGLNATQNISGALPNTYDNINMDWPTMMGGGYHFMKMEGHYLDTAGVITGFAIHLGKNENLVTVKSSCHLHLQYWNHEHKLVFNINEIFQSPYTYNLNIDPSYTMSDSIAMFRIKENMTDAFQVE